MDATRNGKKPSFATRGDPAYPTNQASPDLDIQSLVFELDHAFHTWPALVLSPFIAFRLSTMQGDQSASS